MGQLHKYSTHDCNDRYSSNTKFASIHILLHTYALEQLNAESTAANESILALLSKQTESSHSHVGKMPNNFPPMAWLGYF
jgi:hypothetical protein